MQTCFNGTALKLRISPGFLDLTSTMWTVRPVVWLWTKSRHCNMSCSIINWEHWYLDVADLNVFLASPTEYSRCPKSLFFFPPKVQRCYPQHLLCQWHVSRPSAHSLFCNKGMCDLKSSKNDLWELLFKMVLISISFLFLHQTSPPRQTCKSWLSFLCVQAFVDFFSRGLQEEYRRQGIIIQVSLFLVWWDSSLSYTMHLGFWVWKLSHGGVLCCDTEDSLISVLKKQRGSDARRENVSVLLLIFEKKMAQSGAVY